MDDFANKGPVVKVGDAMAALAMVRALCRKLTEMGVISLDDLNSIVKDALQQVANSSPTVGAQEAKHLIEQFHQSLAESLQK